MKSTFWKHNKRPKQGRRIDLENQTNEKRFRSQKYPNSINSNLRLQMQLYTKDEYQSEWLGNDNVQYQV